VGDGLKKKSDQLGFSINLRPPIECLAYSEKENKETIAKFVESAERTERRRMEQFK